MELIKQERSSIIPPLSIPYRRQLRNKQCFGPTQISTDKRVFFLKRPLECTIEEEENYWLASNDDLNIHIPAPTREEAEYLFAEAFDELYEFFVLTKHKSMTKGASELRNCFVDFIEAVYNR